MTDTPTPTTPETKPRTNLAQVCAGKRLKYRELEKRFLDLRERHQQLKGATNANEPTPE